MNLADLVRITAWPDVEGALRRLFPGRTQQVSAYRRLFEELGSMVPSPQAMRVSIEEELLPPDNLAIVQVLGRDGTLQRDVAGWPELFEEYAGSPAGDREVTFTLCRYSNADWLGMTVEPATLRSFTQGEVLAYLLVEMTRLGFSDARRQAAHDAMLLDAHKRTMPDGFQYH
ncbi:DUF6557 family protein [Solimonas sp. SE-A11]|uniref:DUF6557 family protein n=1 Tax=Solimonas sp. SE-A11 TaxID=3054954 RepID=UPI00259CBB02|nr:DUF6557 family protein [Solimonas sp. SE-A11]MDM4769058.1 hypothetical protein [Solimonas sp. SE-A11]